MSKRRVAKFLMVVPFFLLGCKGKYTYETYLSDPTFTDNNVVFSVQSISENYEVFFGWGYYEFKFDLAMTNNGDANVSFVIENPRIVDEKNKEDIKNFVNVHISIEKGQTRHNSIQASLDKSYKESKYSLLYEFNSKTVCHHFY